MPELIYVVGPDGKSDRPMPDEKPQRCHDEQTRALAGHLPRRRTSTTTAAVGPR